MSDTVKDAPRSRESRGDARENSKSDTESEKERLVSQDGGDSVLYTHDISMHSEGAVEEHTSREWKAPDGGWGYVVVLSAFILSVIVDGLSYSFGVMLADLEGAFQAPKSQVVLANSMQVGAYMLIGPVASAFTNAFGCRKVIIAGTLLSGLAYMVSICSTEISVLVITYGVLAGMGFGLMYLPTIVAVSLYFDRKRALATCIAMCGSGVGALVMAPLSEFLLQEFGWRGTILIQGAILLNGLVCGVLVRPLHMDAAYDDSGDLGSVEKARVKVRKTGEARKGNVQDFEIREIGRVKTSGAVEVQEKLLISRPSPRRRGSSSGHRRGSTDEGHWLVVGRRARHRSGDHHCTSRPVWSSIWEAIPGITLTDHDEERTIVILEIQRLREAARRQGEETGRNRSMSEPRPRAAMKGAVAQSSSAASSSTGGGGAAAGGGGTANIRVLHASSHRTTVSPTACETKDEHRFIQSEPLPGTKHHTKGTRRGSQFYPHSRTPFGLTFIGLADSQETTHDQLVRSMDSTSPASQGDSCCGGSWSVMGDSFKEALREMLNFSILKNKSFWLVLTGNFFVLLGLYIPYVYLSDRAVDLGYDETQAAYLISIIGATNVISRAMTGVVMHYWNMNTALATGLALLTASAAVAACPLVEAYSMLSLLAGVFGFTTAVFMTLCSVLLCDLMGVNSLANAFGFVVLSRGVSCILGPPLAGALMDATGRIDEAFFISALMMMIGGLCHVILYVFYMSPCGIKGHRVSNAEDSGTAMAVRDVTVNGDNEAVGSARV